MLSHRKGLNGFEPSSRKTGFRQVRLAGRVRQVNLVKTGLYGLLVKLPELPKRHNVFIAYNRNGYIPWVCEIKAHSDLSVLPDRHYIWSSAYCP
jgi:hypothetical protein